MNDSENDKPDITTEGQEKITSSALRRDLTLLCLNELFIGDEPFRLIKKQNTFFLRYEMDGIVSARDYLSPALWRAKILFGVAEGKDFRVLQMDRPGRYQEMFPSTLLRRLLWHSRPKANFPPIARLYDPNGSAEILLTRSRLCGHAVDALHNLGGTPRFQPLWLSDIMALRPMGGIELIRDEQFATAAPISRYLQAAVLTGRIVKEEELQTLPLEGQSTSLSLPPVASTHVVRLLERVTRQANPPFEPLSCTIYDDYDFG